MFTVNIITAFTVNRVYCDKTASDIGSRVNKISELSLAIFPGLFYSRFKSSYLIQQIILHHKPPTKLSSRILRYKLFFVTLYTFLTNVTSTLKSSVISISSVFLSSYAMRVCCDKTAELGSRGFRWRWAQCLSVLLDKFDDRMYRISYNNIIGLACVRTFINVWKKCSFRVMLLHTGVVCRKYSHRKFE